MRLRDFKLTKGQYLMLPSAAELTEADLKLVPIGFMFKAKDGHLCEVVKGTDMFNDQWPFMDVPERGLRHYKAVIGEKDEQDHLATLHTTTMTQAQRQELIRIITVKSDGDERGVTLEQAAPMTDRQIHLTWLWQCAYISPETYKREFGACAGTPVQLTRPA